MNNYPSIFNEVIGPVMRGPSSSHTAASWRIARICLQILQEPVRKAIIEFTREGAWWSNYREQGTAMGIEGGLLGLDITDDRMKNTGMVAHRQSVEFGYRTSHFQAGHPNTLRLHLEGPSGRKVRVQAVSTGGGAFEIQQIDHRRVSIRGDRSEPITTPYAEQILLDPVLPVVSGNEKPLPFDTIESMLDYAGRNDLDFGDLGIIYEECRSGLSREELIKKMEHLAGVTDGSIRKGLEGTEYEDRILGRQSQLIGQAEKEGRIAPSLVSRIIAHVTAIMEAKSAMEVIVAHPTAGSSGTVGGVLKAVAGELGSTPDEVIRAYFASGLTGAWFAMGPGFSAEEHGCQVECGAASGMTAAATVQLMGGTARQAVDAASMAIQNMIGLICDPVADRVEVPCLGKNISAAMNALSSATMAMAGFDAVIPLEEVLQTVSEVGRQMPACVKCTGKGGLAITPASRDIKNRLKNQ